MTLYVIILAIRRKYNMNTELSEDIYIANISKKETYTPEEKKFILDRLNNERLLKQKSKEESLKVTYKFANKEYYKFVNMEREYYLAKESCGKFSSRPSIVSLYYRTFGEMKRKDVLLKIEAHTEKIFISYDAIRVYFKPYSFEVKR
jgi:hypothetical protein